MSKIAEKLKQLTHSTDLEFQIIEVVSFSNDRNFIVAEYKDRYFFIIEPINDLCHGYFSEFLNTTLWSYKYIWNSTSLDEIHDMISQYILHYEKEKFIKKQLENRKDDYVFSTKIENITIEYLPEKISENRGMDEISFYFSIKDKDKQIGYSEISLSQFIPCWLLGDYVIDGDSFLSEPYQRKGIMTELYDFTESLIGLSRVPHGTNHIPGSLTDESKGFWDKRLKTHFVPGITSPVDEQKEEKLKDMEKYKNQFREDIEKNLDELLQQHLTSFKLK